MLKDIFKTISDLFQSNEDEKNILKEQVAKLEADLAIMEDEASRPIEKKFVSVDDLEDYILDAPVVDIRPILDAIAAIKVAPNGEYLKPVLDAIAAIKLPSATPGHAPVNLEPVLAAIKNIKMPDFGLEPVLAAIRAIKPPVVSYSLTGDAKHLTAEINALRTAVAKLPQTAFVGDINMNMRPVLDAIARIPRSTGGAVDLAPILAAIQAIKIPAGSGGSGGSGSVTVTATGEVMALLKSASASANRAATLAGEALAVASDLQSKLSRFL